MKHSYLVGANLAVVCSALTVDAVIAEVVCGDLVMGPAIEGNDLNAGVS